MRRIYSVVLLACTFLVSCGNDEGFTFTPIPSGELTIVNVIPASPELTITTNNRRSGDIAFGGVLGPTDVLPQIPLDIRAAFFNNGVDQTVLAQAFTLDIDIRQTVVLTGTIASATAVSIIEPPFVYADGSNDTRIRFMNAATNVASATLTLTNPNGINATVAMTNGQPTGFTTTTAGTNNQIEIRDTSSNAVLWRSGEFTLSPRTDKLYMLVDYFGPGDETVRMISVADASQASPFQNEELVSGVRFVNQTSDRGQLDFLVDGNLAASLNFGEFSNFISFPPAISTITVTPAGDPSTELNSVDRVLFLGQFGTLHAAASTDESTVRTSFYQEDRRRIDSQAILNVTKLAPATGDVDLYFQDPGEALSGFADVASLVDFTSGPLFIPPGDYDLYVTEAGNTNVLVGPQTLTLNSRGIYTLQVVESAGGGLPIVLSLLDDF
ncbi:MAG: WD40 repeat protein [Planctomycetaceae bacterium]|jgi:WD40 repeat protein